MPPHIRGRKTMKIKSIVAAAAITLIAGVGSVSADENDVADTANDTGTPFAMLDGIATEQMSVQDMAATRGQRTAAGVFELSLTITDPGNLSVRSRLGWDLSSR